MTPEWITSAVVLETLEHLRHDRTTVALNKSRLHAVDLPAIEQRIRAERRHRVVAIPHDDELAVILDAGHYALDPLRRPTRIAIKRLGHAIAEQPC